MPLELEQVSHWVVLDGPLEPGVVAALEMLVKGEGLTLTNGDTLLLPRMYPIYYTDTSIHLDLDTQNRLFRKRSWRISGPCNAI